METTSKTKPEFKRSLETQCLIEHALELKVGDIFTYEQMQEATGRRFPQERHYWTSARMTLLREHQFHFMPVNTIGYQRIGYEAAVLSTKSMEHQKRYARRRVTALAAGKYEELSDAAKFRHNAELCIQQIMHRTASQKSIKKIEAAIQQDQKITVTDTLRALGYKGI